MENSLDKLFRQVDDINEEFNLEKRRIEEVNQNLQQNNKLYNSLLESIDNLEDEYIIEGFIISNNKIIMKNDELIDELLKEKGKKINEIEEKISFIKERGDL